MNSLRRFAVPGALIRCAAGASGAATLKEIESAVLSVSTMWTVPPNLVPSGKSATVLLFGCHGCLLREAVPDRMNVGPLRSRMRSSAQAVCGVRSKLDFMAYEIPVTQARAELAELINRVVYGGERVVVTRHGKPLVALVSAADLEQLEALQEAAEEPMITTGSSVREVASAPREQRRFGITAEHRGSGAS